MSKSIFIELYNSSDDDGIRDQFVKAVEKDEVKEEYKDNYILEGSWGENGEVGSMNDGDIDDNIEELTDNDDWWYIILHEIKVD